jgi:hypothetical protein
VQPKPLCLPQIYALAKKKDDLVVTTAGLVTKASTRRFSSPEADRQEERRRAQIQNRVHKHQLFEVDCQSSLFAIHISRRQRPIVMF